MFMMDGFIQHCIALFAFRAHRLHPNPKPRRLRAGFDVCHLCHIARRPVYQQSAACLSSSLPGWPVGCFDVRGWLIRLIELIAWGQALSPSFKLAVGYEWLNPNRSDIIYADLLAMGTGVYHGYYQEGGLPRLSRCPFSSSMLPLLLVLF